MKSPPGRTASEVRLLPHVAAAGVFVAVAVAWTFPLVRHLSTHLPGAVPGDNVGFLWNFWWMRTALASGLDFFYTPYLFAPAGADLTLHTHTALPAFAGATVLGALPIIDAQNLAILTGLFLNGFCAYLLAWRLTRHHGAAIIGGLVFGGSPYVAAHLSEHFNLTMAWTIPLVAMAASDAVRGSTRAAVLAGLVVGITAYIDYYYVVYELALVLCFAALASRDWSISWRRAGPHPRRLAVVLGIVMLVDLAVIAAILVTRGFDARIGPLRISAHEIFNPLQAFWILAALLLGLWLRPRIGAERRETPAPGRVAGMAVLVTAVFLVSAAPLVWKGAQLIVAGEYVTQPYFWRSAPKGVDLATFVLGNPFHGLWGDDVRGVYRTFGIDAVEATGWLGIAPVILAAWALRRPSSRIVRQWAVIGAAFLVWALGPHLMVFGSNTGMILPQAFMRYVPLLANARMPGRAMVVTYLALAVLAAVAAAEWHRRFRGGAVALVAIACVVIADNLPAPFPVLAMDRPAIYEALRDRPEPGAVCELPLGIRHGFGSRGAFDNRVSFYQTIHQRPMLGGFIARLPEAVAAWYDNDPLLSGLLRLSEQGGSGDAGGSLPNRELAAERLRANGVRFVVLNRSTASPALVDYVERVLPLTLLAEEGERRLYVMAEIP